LKISENKMGQRFEPLDALNILEKLYQKFENNFIDALTNKII